MVLSCPRCGTEVPSEALYCPYCSLPKPKRGFAAAEEKSEETAAPESSKPGVRFTRTRKDGYRPAKRSTGRSAKPQRRLRLPVLGVAALVALAAIGIYVFVVPLLVSDHPEPKTVLAALEKLRKAPSNEPGLTIEARLSRQLETARRVGNLVGYQGWTVRPMKGTKTRVFLVFSYQEVGDVNQKAEWLADLTNNTFAPQTELAATVNGKP